jgi:phosphopantetheinyl transferase
MLIPIRFEREGRPVRVSMAASFRSELEALKFEEWFGERERAWIEQFRYPVRRESFVLGRLAAKRAVIGLGERSVATSFQIAKGVFEQPLLVPNEWEVSIAHSSGAAVAIACEPGHPVGIDLERATRVEIEVLNSSFTEAEKVLLKTFPGALEESYAFGWCMKEAVAKALRCGLMTPMPILEFMNPKLHPDGSIEVEFVNFAQFKALAWKIGGFVLALAVPKKTNLVMALRPEFANRLGDV